MKTPKVYIRGNSERGFDVIKELVKLGANNAHDHYGDICFNYYYIDSENNIRAVEDVNLLKSSGYREVLLPPPCRIVPFSSSDELKKACDEHGSLVRNKKGISLFDIGRIISLIKAYHTDEEAFGHLMEFYEFEDGSPCGVVIENK